MPPPRDAELLELALCVANEDVRRACARAILDSPEAVLRLREMMARADEIDEALGDSTGDERARRAMARYAARAERARRALAEGLPEGEAILRHSLAELRVGWRLAGRLGDHGAVADFAEALAGELMERGAWEELHELAALGYAASDALERPRLRSRLLSYEGAGAARRGDVPRAVQLWTARVELNRLVGNPVAEADALLDLAGEALQAGETERWEGWIAQAEDAVARAGRADLAARLWTYHAQERLLGGDPQGASRYSESAAAALSGTLGSDVGFSVRVTAARTLSSTGHGGDSIRALAPLLASAIDGSRPAQAASAVEAMGDAAASLGAEPLARACRLAYARIHGDLGTRHADPEVERASVDGAGVGEWSTSVREVLALVEELRPETVAA